MPLTLTGPDDIPRLIQAAPIGISITDATGRYEMVNPAYCDFYGYAEQELLGQPFTMMVPSEQRGQLLEMHQRLIRGEEDLARRQEWEVRRKNGERRTIIAEAARLFDDAGEAKKVTFVTDITERKALERRLDYLARHDELTGLLNRRAGLARLEEEIARHRRLGGALCVAICDLDHFKQVNDRYGHTAGDEALQGAADALLHGLRHYDVLARLGGEEFLVILPGVTRPDAETSLERLRCELPTKPLARPGLRLTFSAGVAALAGNEASHALLERADRALYRAKAAGRNRIRAAQDG
ncbi:GGDEF domain-containing protein [Halomonas organivorans]|uniref:diguanylate cyclase n=1 Tax=Halomonas organivorans TaxID=257772 RepID=A0A7W5BUJ6_9GAMM|nr:sensor domain-containing diguanylate cyclase [Halomonas organivorans]MBB3139406.1 diguanylate cyclase (GGDEF)-like protein/PAS domain S-box-containing protein [Halomonas organivorans]